MCIELDLNMSASLKPNRMKQNELSRKTSQAIISSNIFPPKLEFTGNPYLRGRLSTVDLRVLTSFDQLLLMTQVLLTFLPS